MFCVHIYDYKMTGYIFFAKRQEMEKSKCDLFMYWLLFVLIQRRTASVEGVIDEVSVLACSRFIIGTLCYLGG